MPGPSKKTCFVAMPLTTRPDEAKVHHDPDHWRHVFQTLIEPAVRAAGFEVLAPGRIGSEHITAQIITDICTADLMVCDLSSGNANVFFEFGMRTSLNLPVAVIHDDLLETLPFDVQAINAHEYDYKAHTLPQALEALTEHIRAADRTSHGHNTLWNAYGKTYTAERDALVAGLEGEIDALQRKEQELVHKMGDAPRLFAHLEEVKTQRDLVGAERDELHREVQRLQAVADRNVLRVRELESSERKAKADLQGSLAKARTAHEKALAEARSRHKEELRAAQLAAAPADSDHAVELQNLRSELDSARAEVKAKTQEVAKQRAEVKKAQERAELAEQSRRRLLSPARWAGWAVGISAFLAFTWTLGHYLAPLVHVHPSRYLVRTPNMYLALGTDLLAGFAFIAVFAGVMMAIVDEMVTVAGIVMTVVVTAVFLALSLGLYALA